MNYDEMDDKELLKAAQDALAEPRKRMEELESAETNPVFAEIYKLVDEKRELEDRIVALRNQVHEQVNEEIGDWTREVIWSLETAEEDLTPEAWKTRMGVKLAIDDWDRAKLVKYLKAVS